MENKDTWICYCCRGLCRCASCINGSQQQGNVEVPLTDQTDIDPASSPTLPPAFSSVKRSSSSETTPVKQPHIAADISPKQHSTQIEPNPSQSTMPSSSLLQAESLQPSQVQTQQSQQHASQSSKSETTTESSNTTHSRKGSKSSSCDLSVYSNRRIVRDMLCRVYVSLCHLYFC